MFSPANVLRYTVTSYFVTTFNAELIERVTLFEWFRVYQLFQDFFVLSTNKGDLVKCWVDRIERLDYATHASQLVTNIV